MMAGVSRLLLAACLGLWACSVEAPQVGLPSPESASVEPYLGQTPPGDTAVLFAPGVVSVEGRFEFGVSFSPDGRELLFTGQAPGEPAGLVHLVASDGRWSFPEKSQLAGGKKSQEMEAFFTPDGRSVLFAAFDEGMMDARIWRLDRGPDGWTSPRSIGSPVSEDPAFYPTATNDGAIYYTNLAHRAIYRAMTFGDSVGEVVDTGLNGMHAFISPDESFVLLDVREGEGDADLFVAFRLPNGSWSEAVDLGPGVNTGVHETCPSLSSDGRFIFFSRYDEPNGLPNIYWVSSELVERARSSGLNSSMKEVSAR